MTTLAASMLILCGVPDVTSAEPVTTIDKAYGACIDGTTTNAEWAQCGAEAIERAEAHLQAVWNSVYPLTDGGSKSDLLSEQRLWIVYKDKSCLFWADGEQWGREGQVLSFPSCRLQVIHDRIKLLEELKNQIEGE